MLGDDFGTGSDNAHSGEDVGGICGLIEARIRMALEPCGSRRRVWWSEDHVSEVGVEVNIMARKQTQSCYTGTQDCVRSLRTSALQT